MNKLFEMGDLNNKIHINLTKCKWQPMLAIKYVPIYMHATK